MLFLDKRGYLDLYLLLQQVLGEDVDRRDLNDQGYADVLWFDHQGHSCQVEIKQSGELLGSISHVEEQLTRQIPVADQTSLLVYGVTTPDGAGCATWKSANNGNIMFQNHQYAQNYLGLRAKLAMFQQLGVPVYEVPTVEAAAAQLVALYQNAQRDDHKTFKQLIKTKQWLQEQDPEKKAFLLTISSIEGARWGEELASALWPTYVTVAQVVDGLRMGEAAGMAELKLESGRRIGKAAVEKLGRALGV